MMRTTCNVRWLVLGLMMVFGFAPAVSAQALDITIPAATDYLYTQPGTYADFPAPLGPTALVGNPVLPGGTDTSVDRLTDADATTGASINTTLTSLNLMGTTPIGTVFVTLDPALGPSTGTMSFLTVGPTVPGTEIGGTISDLLTVNYQVTNAAGTVLFTGTEMFTSRGTWEAFLPVGATEVTNFMIILDTHVDPGVGQHVVSSFAVPEPNSWIMLAIAGFAVPTYAGWRRRRTLQSRAGQ